MTKDEAVQDFTEWLMREQERRGAFTQEQVELAAAAWFTSGLIRAKTAAVVVERLIGVCSSSRLVELLRTELFPVVAEFQGEGDDLGQKDAQQ